MQTCVFLDLDDTLFQTLRKCPPGAAAEELSAAAYHRDGRPLSFMTERQRALLRLFSSGRVIPTTARNHDSFRRVDLPFDDLAILDFGGVVLLSDGSPDAEWDGRIRPQAKAVGDELQGVRDQISGWSEERSLGVSVRVIGDFDMPLYVVVKHLEGNVQSLETIRRQLEPRLDHERFFLHLNDNNLSVAPRFLGKHHAVRYVMERHLREPTLTIGVGDSLTDAAFMQLCDYCLTPRGSQLYDAALACEPAGDAAK